jgi:hypothetical protein
VPAPNLTFRDCLGVAVNSYQQSFAVSDDAFEPQKLEQRVTLGSAVSFLESLATSEYFATDFRSLQARCCTVRNDIEGKPLYTVTSAQ